MTKLTQKSVILYLVLVFLAGAVAGGGIGYNYARNSRRPPPERDGKPTDWIMRGLQKELTLSQEQVDQIRPIIEKGWSRMDEIHKSNEAKITSCFLDMNREMAPFLSPEQKEKLSQLERKRQEWSSRRGPHGRGGPPRH